MGPKKSQNPLEEKASQKVENETLKEISGTNVLQHDDKDRPKVKKRERKGFKKKKGKKKGVLKENEKRMGTRFGLWKQDEG